MTLDLSARLRALLAPLAQLTLLVGVAWALGLEEAAGLPGALALGVVGWVIHELAAPSWKPRVFLAIALAIFGWRLGWDALFVVCAGLVISEITVLPVALPLRIGLLLVAAAEIAWTRLRFGDVMLRDEALALLGSMFMFRSVLVLLDPNAAAAGRLQRWTYFFQWPNALFLLYPVVDWQAWTRPPATPTAALHQRGVRWIARGFSHLLVYRLVYHLVLPADWEVEDARSLLWWMLGSFGLYVRISGVFHIAVGLLLLFGRDLPRTQNRYFLASSFSDHYRRVNIYWTAFLEQLVFLPAWFRLRRWKVPQAHVLAVLLTFAASWALHHWQSFWITGRLHITATDTTFWAILGLLVSANTAWATSRPARRRPAYLLHAAKVVGTFTAMTVLWSLWKSETFDLWLARMRLLQNEPRALLALLGVLGGAVLTGAAMQWALDQPGSKAILARLPRGGLAACAALAVIALAVQRPLPEGAPRWAVQARSALAAEHLSLGDEVAKTHGYYDDLGPVRAVNLAALREPPPGWGWFRDTPMARPTPKNVPFEFELVPSSSGLFRGLPFTVNRHGMRDKEYSLDKPPGTYRIALLGASPEMGEGVGDDEVFSALIEEQLNRAYGRPGRRFEVLNFAVSSRTLDAAVVLYPRKVRAFQPDLVLLADHTTDEVRMMGRIARTRQMGRPFPGKIGPRLAATLDHRLAPEVAGAQLHPYAPEVTRELQEILVREVKADGAKIAWLYVPMPSDLHRPPPPELLRRAQDAMDAGMIPINLNGAYGQRSPREIEVAPWDGHPNALGHRLLAQRLLQKLVELDAELGLGLSR